MISFCLAAKPASNSNGLGSLCPIWQQQLPCFSLLLSQLLSLSHILQWFYLSGYCSSTVLRRLCSLHPSPTHCKQFALRCMLETSGRGLGGGRWVLKCCFVAVLWFLTDVCHGSHGSGTHRIIPRELAIKKM